MWLPFECYSLTTYARLPIACQQRSIVADLEEYPPCPGSFAHVLDGIVSRRGNGLTGQRRDENLHSGVTVG